MQEGVAVRLRYFIILLTAIHALSVTRIHRVVGHFAVLAVLRLRLVIHIARRSLHGLCGKQDEQ